MSVHHPENIAGIIGIDNLHEPGGPMPEEQQKQMAGFFFSLLQSFDSMAKCQHAEYPLSASNGQHCREQGDE